jgi:colanic acid/amylovoran biosynthesis glycosyltransferase
VISRPSEPLATVEHPVAIRPPHGRTVSGEIRVVHAVSEWLAPTKTWLYHEIASLPRDRVVSSVIADLRNPATPAAFRGVPVDAVSDRRLPFFLYRVVRRSRRWPANTLLRRRLRDGAIDVVHSHFGHVGWASSRLLGNSRQRHIVTFYGWDVTEPVRTPVWQGRYRALFGAVDLVLCEGEHMAAAVALLGCPPSKLRVHHLGIKTEAIAFNTRQYTSNEPLRILMAAAFKTKKGLPDGLRAVARLRKSYPRLHVTVVGDAEASPSGQQERLAIERTVEDCGLEDVVTFLGMRSAAELFELAYTHHLFLSPSLTTPDGETEGGAPVSIIEMAATGMPVVSTTHCDIPGVLGEPNRALLTPEGDVQALHGQLERLLGMTDWTALATANRRHIEREFDLTRQGLRLAEIYSEVMERGPS